MIKPGRFAQWRAYGCFWLFLLVLGMACVPTAPNAGDTGLILVKARVERTNAEAIGVTVHSGSSITRGAPGKEYTIAWLSDTQHYNGSLAPIFHSMTSYLKEKQSALNIQYIAMTGDIVGSGGSTSQWMNARAAMDSIAHIPHGVLAGNHDYGKESGLKNYKEYFGERHYAGRPWYGGSYQDNRNHYDLMTMGATQYLFVYLSYQPDSDDIAWANGVFGRYPGRVGVLLTHDYLDSYSSLRSNGKTLQEEIVKQNRNIYLVLCGHRYTEDNIPVQFDDDGDGAMDRTVYQCIANYQNLSQGGGGYIRFLRIDEAKGTIRFHTYSPYLGVYRAPPERAKNPQDTWPVPWMAAEQANAAA
ncbi:MAG TPA: metallophosphoesterase [Feifaniaceae bacterium]|nr:metallophosphoesterase [Feifaniaceae bacterium]